MSLHESDRMLIVRALHYWANHIETGNMLLSIQDAVNIKNEKLIKSLTPEQKKFVTRLRELASHHLEAK